MEDADAKMYFCFPLLRDEPNGDLDPVSFQLLEVCTSIDGFECQDEGQLAKWES